MTINFFSKNIFRKKQFKGFFVINNYNNKFNTLADQIVKMESLYNQIITERQALDKRHKENSSSMYAGSTKTRRRRRRK